MDDDILEEINRMKRGSRQKENGMTAKLWKWTLCVGLVLSFLAIARWFILTEVISKAEAAAVHNANIQRIEQNEKAIIKIDTKFDGFQKQLDDIQNTNSKIYNRLVRMTDDR